MTTELPLPELERLHFLINCISQAAKDRGRDWQSMVIDISEAVETVEKVRAEVDAAIAADRAQRVEWLPIETAPKDRVPVLLTNGKDVAQGEWEDVPSSIVERRDIDGRYIGQDEHDGFTGWIDYGGGMLPEPTHWMPIPPAPTQTPPATAQTQEPG